MKKIIDEWNNKEDTIQENSIVANKSVDDGSNEFFLQKTLCKNVLQRVQSKIAMGLKCEKKLASEINHLHLRKAKLSKGKV